MSGVSDILMVMLVLGGLYVLIKSGKLEELMKGGLQLPALPGLPMPGGGGGGAPSGPSGPISGGGGCPGGETCQRDDKGRYDCNNVTSDSYEATWCGSCTGDRLSIKLYGPPHHSSGDCCWCILYVDNGKFIAGGEGPHPSSNCDKKSGGSMGSSTSGCVKAVMTPGPTLRGYGLVGGQWKELVSHTGPCGCSKTANRKTGNQVTFRCDGNFQTKCATVRPLGGAAGGVRARNVYSARCRSRYDDIQNSILSRI